MTSDRHRSCMQVRSKQFTTSDVDHCWVKLPMITLIGLASGRGAGVEDYVNHHPEIGDLIRQTFAAVSLIDHSHAGTFFHAAFTGTEQRPQEPT